MQWVVDLEETPAGIVSVAIMETCTRPQSHWKVWSLTLACGMSRLSQKKLETGIFSEQSGDSHVCCMSSLDYKSFAGQQNSILRRVGDLLNPVRTLHWYMGLCGGGLTIPAIAAGKLPYACLARIRTTSIANKAGTILCTFLTQQPPHVKQQINCQCTFKQHQRSIESLFHSTHGIPQREGILWDGQYTVESSSRARSSPAERVYKSAWGRMPCDPLPGNCFLS